MVAVNDVLIIDEDIDGNKEQNILFLRANWNFLQILLDADFSRIPPQFIWIYGK
jgi:hypothetical protein